MGQRFETALFGLVMLLAAAAGSASAEVSAQEAAKLGSVLTPVGAERAGNAAGTIPAWTGGIQQPPAGYKKGQRHPDPYPDDEPLFTITAENAHEHEKHLSKGQLAMLAAYPNSCLFAEALSQSAMGDRRSL